MTSNKIILLNAPKGSGKNTIAEALHKNYNTVLHSFKSPIFEIAAKMVGMHFDDFLKLYDDRRKKEFPCEECLGYSCRELFIAISEDFCKPKFGLSYFGKIAANNMDSVHLEKYGYVFSDSGFIEEIIPIADKFGKDKCVIVQFTGQDSNNFTGDSRGWVDGRPVGIHTVKIEMSNKNISPAEYANHILEKI